MFKPLNNLELQLSELLKKSTLGNQIQNWERLLKGRGIFLKHILRIKRRTMR